MKLKPIVASMILMGLTAPAFAASNYDTQSQLDSMKAQLAKMESVLKQNQAGGFGQSADWFNRITVSGMVNADAHYANKTPTIYSGKSSNAVKLNNANLFIHALVNEWVTGDLDFTYGDTNSIFSRHDTSNVLDEAYVTIGNFAKNPFYFRAGKTYVPFGVYDRYPLVQDNATQLLSETRGTSAQVGFVSPMGFYASVYGVQGAQPDGDIHSGILKRTRMDNFGANLGYAYNSEKAGFKIDAGYLNNLNDVNYIAYRSDASNYGFSSRDHGLSLSADLRASAFDVGAKYVTYLKNVDNTYGKHLKPYAAGLTAGVTFPVLAHATRFGLGYQHTKDAASLSGNDGLALPENRYYGEYTFNISKWTDVGLAVVHDRDYNNKDGGTDRTATSGVARLSVKFA